MQYGSAKYGNNIDIIAVVHTLHKVKVIISDWDDTQVSTLQSCIDFNIAFAEEYNLNTNVEASMISLWGKPINDIIKGVWPEAGDTLEADFWNYMEIKDFTIQPFPKTEETVMHLIQKGYDVAVVTSTSRRVIEKTLARYFKKPQTLYRFIQTQEDSVYHKPDPKVFDPAMETLKVHGIGEEEVLYMGDSLTDYTAATKRGLPFLAVTTGFTSKDTFLKHGLESQYILNSFADLTAIFP